MLLPRRHAVVGLLALSIAASPAAGQRGSGTPASAAARPLAPTRARLARALLRDRLPCAGCHVIDAAGGGRVGPDLTTVRARRDAAYITRMVDDPAAVVPLTRMPRVPMAAATRALVIGYLGGDTAIARPRRAPAVERTLNVAEGAALYARYCAVCHGDGGRGDGPNARWLAVPPANHSDAAAMAARTDDRLFDAIASGGYPLGRSAAMPAFGATLSRSEIRALVRHIRTLCRCAPPAWSTDGARDGTGTRR